MLDKDLDPPCDLWELLREDCDWLDDLYNEWCEREEEKALHNYECKVFNELDRRLI